MANFLIHDAEKKTYYDVLQVSCVVHGYNYFLHRVHTYEKDLFDKESFKKLNIVNSYELDGIEDIQKIEDECKTNLLALLKEQRDKKVNNHRCTFRNYILKVNGHVVFDCLRVFGSKSTWDLTDEQLEEAVAKIHFAPMGIGIEYAENVADGYLI